MRDFKLRLGMLNPVLLQSDIKSLSEINGPSYTYNRYPIYFIYGVLILKYLQPFPLSQDVHRVNIGDYDLTSSFDYYSIPRLDKDVFLNAHVTDWAKLNLLEGTANVFFKGAYVGQTNIRADQTSDTLEILDGPR